MIEEYGKEGKEEEIGMDDPTPKALFFRLWHYFINIFAAFVFVAILGGGIYAVIYLSERDFSNIPIIRASNAPIKVLPEDPGGVVSEHTDISVNEALEARAGLAPRERTEGTEGTKGTDDQFTPPRIAGNDGERGAPVLAHKPSNLQAPPSNSAPQLPRSKRPLPEALSAGETPTLEGQNANAARAEKPIAPERSSLPTHRPTTLHNKEETWLASIGTFKRQRLAHAIWDVLVRKFDNEMAGKQRFVERQVQDGKELFLLKVGSFKNRAQTFDFCEKLKKEKINCVPMKKNKHTGLGADERQ